MTGEQFRIKSNRLSTLFHYQRNTLGRKCAAPDSAVPINRTENRTTGNPRKFQPLLQCTYRADIATRMRNCNLSPRPLLVCLRGTEMDYYPLLHELKPG